MEKITTRLRPVYRSYFDGLAASVFAIFGPLQAHAHDVKPSMSMGDVVNLPASAKKFDDPLVAGGLNAVVNAYKIWTAGAVLKACFTEGTPEVKQLFVDAEREWEKYANLKWDFGRSPDYALCDNSHPSHVRIAFDRVGHWSRVGTDAILRSVINQPSLNIDIESFGDLRLVDKNQVIGVMLHEIGHAYGLEHEHQSPNDKCIRHIRWSVVYTEMAQPPNSWDQTKVDQNLKALVDTDRLRTTAYDKTSIMHYAFPAKWFDDPSCAVGQNLTLSVLDKQEVALAYPGDAKQQGKFVAAVSAAAQSALSSLRLSDDEKKAVQDDVKSLKDELDEKLRAETLTVSNGRDNLGIFFGSSVSLQSNGPNSPVVNATQGNVEINIGDPKSKQ